MKQTLDELRQNLIQKMLDAHLTPAETKELADYAEQLLKSQSQS